MRLTVIGTGYVGLVTGAGLSDFGNDVICADVDGRKVARLQAGEMPFYEPGLAALAESNVAKGRLRFSSDVSAAVAAAEVVFIAAGTPSAADGSADLSTVFAAAETIGRSIRRYALVVTKSTVPVGTAERLKEIIAAHTREPFAVVSNPEFLKEGDAANVFLATRISLMNESGPSSPIASPWRRACTKRSRGRRPRSRHRVARVPPARLRAHQGAHA